MVLHHGKLPPPRRLVTYGRGVIAFRFPLHGHPGQVRHAHRYAQRGLPVALQLIAPEIVIPAGHAVELAEHALLAALTYDGLGLLCRGVFMEVAQHVYARDAEMRIAAHGVAHGVGLPFQRGLHITVAREFYAPLIAPGAYLPAEIPGKTLGDQVMKAPAELGKAPVGVFPHQFRYLVEYVLRILLLEQPGQLARPWEKHVAGVICESQRQLIAHLGLVREYRGHGRTEVIREFPVIRFVGYVYKRFYRVCRQGVRVRLAVEPRILHGMLLIRVPFHAFGRFIRSDPAVRYEPAVRVQFHVVHGQQRAVLLTVRPLSLARHGRPVPVITFVRCYGEHERLHGESGVSGRDFAACGAGGPSVLVVQPRQHAVLPGFLHAVPDVPHEFFVQVRAVHARPDMHVKTAQAHFFQHSYLP